MTEKATGQYAVTGVRPASLNATMSAETPTSGCSFFSTELAEEG